MNVVLNLITQNITGNSMRLIMLLLVSIALTACGTDTADEKLIVDKHDNAGTEQSRNLATRYLLIDTHIDTPIRLMMKPANVSMLSPEGQFDYPRAKTGGLDVAFMSIFIPARIDEEGGARGMAEKLIESVESIAQQYPDQFLLVNSPQQIRDNHPGDKLMLAMGMENGAPMEGNLENVQYFYDKGIRYITLAHSRSNHISDSSYDENRQWGGLSDFGKDLVQEMNRVGMMIDVSHLSDEAFYQVLEISQVPVLATHSSLRHFVPGFERNMDDDMVKALAKNGGVIQINFGSDFINAVSRANGAARTEALEKHLKDKNVDKDSEEGRALRGAFFKEWDYHYAQLSDVLDHFDRVRALVGINHVGIGSDFDGVGDSLPEGLKHVGEYPNLIAGLISRGYSDEEVEKIMGGNLLRVWEAVESGRTPR
jgi:membrane dipeptidase